MFYCIDYRNGSMGNTILSHILYACNQISVDLEDFFDRSSGNAHKIYHINRSNLAARHLLETPDSDATCVLEILCNDWDEVLRIKMSYAKWYQAVPDLHNYQKFFDYTPCHHNEQLWQEFYQDFRDSSWPAKCSFDQVHMLPELIQKEIFNNYRAPAESIESELLLVEWLCTTYYNMFSNCRRRQFVHSHTIALGDYLKGNVLRLINVAHQLGWNWNFTKSDLFFKKVLAANQQYLIWLNKIKDCTLDVLNNYNVTEILEPWEQALVIAKFCHTNGIDPNSVKWHNIACSSDTNNVYLTQFTRTYHGKTI
jgi:hypothetical protein